MWPSGSYPSGFLTEPRRRGVEQTMVWKILCLCSNLRRGHWRQKILLASNKARITGGRQPLDPPRSFSGCQFRSQSAGLFIECPQESIGREANPSPPWLHGKHLWSSPTFTSWHCVILSLFTNILKRHLPPYCMQIFLYFWCLSCVPLFLFCFLPVTFTSSLSDLTSLKNMVLVAFRTYLCCGLQVLNICAQKPPRKLTILQN